MKLVVYRDKKTNKIKNYHNVNSHCTEEALKSYNENEKYDTMAEFVELEEGSIAHYFYNLKTTEIKSEKEELQDLQDTLDRISNEIDNRLHNFDHLLEGKIKEAKQQAVNEFAEKLKSLPQFEEIYPDEQVFIGDMKSVIDELVKEVCGE